MNPDLELGALQKKGLKKKTRKTTARRSRLKPTSEKRDEEKRDWALIKRAMLTAQLRTNGYTSCMKCGARDPWKLDLDHIVPSGRGGKWAPENAQLLCRTPDQMGCHDRKHGRPEWSKERAS